MLTMLRNYLRNTRATAAVEAALILPLVGAVTFGMLEAAMLMGEMHRSNEAARAATREAILGKFLFTFDDGSTDYTVLCTGDSGTADDPTYSCDETDGTSLHTTTAALEEYTRIFDRAETWIPGLDPSQMVIRYEFNDLALAGLTNVVTPSVTVTLSGLDHDLILLGVFPGIPDTLTLPPAKATRVAATELQ